MRGRKLKLLLAAIALGMWLVVGAVPSSAHMGGCRTDPTVHLSNGYVVTLWADISTDISNVNSVAYVLHVPQGVTATEVDYDANGSVENFQLVADQNGNSYQLQTTVVTSTGGVPFTAYATRLNTTVASTNGTTPAAATLYWGGSTNQNASGNANGGSTTGSSNGSGSGSPTGTSGT